MIRDLALKRSGQPSFSTEGSRETSMSRCQNLSLKKSLLVLPIAQQTSMDFFKDKFWHWLIRGATFWAFFKNHDATLLNASILHQLTLKRPSDPQKNRRHNFPKPKTSNFGPILAYVQKKAHLAILKPPSGAMIVPNLWYWA